MTSIPIFPELFINNKKIYTWKIEIQEKDNIYSIITSHGQLNGKKVSHSKDILEGKGKKTILEQCIQDATRKWINKKEKELYSEKLDENEPLQNSVRPMLANTFSFDVYSKKSRAFKIDFPAYVQRKYDGIRCIAYIKNGEVVLESRKGIQFQNFNLLKDELKHLFNNLHDNFYFDGELYTDKFDFETTSGLIRLHEKKCKETDIALINKIEYHIYDFIDMNNQSMIYSDRYISLNNIMNNELNLCKRVETILVDKLEEVKTYHDSFVQSGFEGIMIRDKNGIYELNKRSKYLQKFKEFLEEEFKIVGFHEGTSDEKGAIVWDCINKDNQKFAVRPKGTFEIRKKLFEEGDKHIGKLLTVIFQEYSTDGIPRFPVGKGIRDFY
jgi:DNA ligase-1